MLLFTIVIIILLLVLRVIICKPVKTTKPVKVATLTRKENATMRSIDRMGW